MEGFAEDIHDGSFNRVKAAHLLDALNNGLKIFWNKVPDFCEWSAEKYYDSLHGDFLAENIKKDIKTLIFVELSKFSTDFIVDGKVGGSVGKAGNHLPKVTLKGYYLIL